MATVLAAVGSYAIARAHVRVDDGALPLNVLTNHFNLAKVDNDWPVVTPRSAVLTRTRPAGPAPPPDRGQAGGPLARRSAAPPTARGRKNDDRPGA